MMLLRLTVITGKGTRWNLVHLTLFYLQIIIILWHAIWVWNVFYMLFVWPCFITFFDCKRVGNHTLYLAAVIRWAECRYCACHWLVYSATVSVTPEHTAISAVYYLSSLDKVHILYRGQRANVQKRLSVVQVSEIFHTSVSNHFIKR